ncbi:MAG: DNA gyrase subunit A [Nitrospirae bacterium]|nr:DNA gyrase subunit A [Nitrospirota bacterium]
MKTSYLNYSMSVIIGRALPDARDGLKPVHRRILFGMKEMGLFQNRPYRKSAKIVGEIMGNYHPHGDSAIYDSMVRMAQDFNMRYLLVDGQGNFGSIDGDPPAAMRYTEARLAGLSDEILADIDKDTVDFGPNYDESILEPAVLPSRVPNLLVNGTSGIAVGMATNIPPHNLGEVIDGAVLLLDNPRAAIDDLCEVVHGPDFPTAGFIHGFSGIKSAYSTGRGIIQMRGRARTEQIGKTDREAIIITELPYQVNKARLIERIAELVRDKKLEGISDLRDESDREGMRIVVELKRGENGLVLLNQLYKHTAMQSTFGVIMLALVDNQPRVLNLQQVLEVFLKHRREVVVRRTRFELRKAEERAHILEGLKIALDHLDAVITLIRQSSNPEEARVGLMREFELSTIQAQAILDMRLQRLTSMEREKLIQEYEELLKQIEYLKSILASETLVKKIIKEELLAIKEKYSDPRRTQIIEESADINLEDTIADEEMVITVSHNGYIKRNPVSIYRSQRRGGKGKIGMGTKEEDFVKQLFVASTHDYILFFTNKGRLHWQKVYQIPEAGRISKGKALVNLLSLGPDEYSTAILPVKEFREDWYVVFATRKGTIKKTTLDSYGHVRAGGIIALTLEEGDSLIAAKLTTGSEDIFLGSKSGIGIRFKEDAVRPTGRNAMGVRGMNLEDGDELVGMEIVDAREGTSIMAVTDKGFGKKTALGQYRVQGRAGKGIITIRASDKTGTVVGILQVTNHEDIMLITAEGKILRFKVSSLREIGRATQGVKLIEVGEKDRVVAVAILAEQEKEEELPSEEES